MAIFTAAASGGDMTFAFVWEIIGFSDIEGGGNSANVLQFTGAPTLGIYIAYTGSGLGNATNNIPRIARAKLDLSSPRNPSSPRIHRGENGWALRTAGRRVSSRDNTNWLNIQTLTDCMGGIYGTA